MPRKTRLEKAEERLGPPPTIEERLRAHLQMRYCNIPRPGLQAREVVRYWEVLHHPQCPQQLRDRLLEGIRKIRGAFTTEYNRRPIDPRNEAYTDQIEYALRIYDSLGIPIDVREE